MWKYILKNCKLHSLFPNSPNLYIFGLQATEILTRFMLYFVLLNFLCNHFVTVSEPKINLNFTNTIQSLGLIAVLTLLHFTHIFWQSRYI